MNSIPLLLSVERWWKAGNHWGEKSGPAHKQGEGEDIREPGLSAVGGISNC